MKINIRSGNRKRKPRRKAARKSKAAKPLTLATLKKNFMYLSEPKYVYEYTTGTEVNDAGFVVDLNDGISQGTATDERIGDRVQFMSVKGRHEIVTKSTAAAGTLNNVRHIVFIWHPDNVVDAPTVAKILEDTTNIPYLSPLVLDKSKRSKFTVLHDFNHILSTRAEGGLDAVLSEPLSFDLSKHPPVLYNPGLTSGRNKLFMMVLGNQATGNNAAQMTYYYKFDFRDV